MTDTISYFNSCADEYGQSHTCQEAASSWSNLLKQEAARLTTPGNRKKRLLNIGIGTGLMDTMFQNACPHWEIYGVDGSTNMLDKCQENGIPKENLRLEDLNKGSISLPDNAADIIISLATLEYIKTAPQIIKEMQRIASPSSLIIFSCQLHTGNSIIDKRENHRQELANQFNVMSYCHPEGYILDQGTSSKKITENIVTAPSSSFPQTTGSRHSIFILEKNMP